MLRSCRDQRPAALVPTEVIRDPDAQSATYHGGLLTHQGHPHHRHPLPNTPTAALRLFSRLTFLQTVSKTEKRKCETNHLTLVLR